MLQYLNILLDDASVSFCHYESRREHKTIPIDILKQAIRFGMTENLMIQFVYPDSTLPKGYEEVIDSIDHFNIKPNEEIADVMVIDKLAEIHTNKPVVLRISKQELFAHTNDIISMFEHVPRLNVVIKDIDDFTEDDFEQYKSFFDVASGKLGQMFIEGKAPQFNLLTDRMMLKEMNNCGAGDSTITLAPNGKFYICPAFYYENEDDNVGDLECGLDIKNKQLYKLNHAPICRHCDAWQCKRCVWLNRKTTLEVNTPSHEQCVVAHLERNASRQLLQNIRKHGSFLPENEDIPELDYLDPFDKREEW
ncbi:MAG: CXXX repeat peptide maturase [Bacteroidaceae bacterium]|nr:CXXX repeat peptide maturase [Bacteroidaceae bacterium]